ncbi:MAG: Ig-like domain-containing protein [Spirochaetaceae bacterium]|jgi:hypothetical protein|nr:Ig-like domain-containing protein [Spirochaetaceae bacterium]
MITGAHGNSGRPRPGRAGAVFLVFALWINSCDILRNGTFDVAAWSPGGGYHDPAGLEVALDFSLEPDRVSVEGSFSLHEDSQNIPGHFSWHGSRMIFTPAAPLEANRDYRILLTTDAQDRRGLSLERQFEASFTTRYGGARPVLASSVPKDGGILEEERSGVELIFPVPLRRSSLADLSFSPAISGVWALEDGDRKAVFTPSEDWSVGREYRLFSGTGVADATGLEAGREYILHFFAGLDCTGPELISASALDPGGNQALDLQAEDGSFMENSSWERNYRLALVFSEPVDTASVSAALSCEPALGMILETPPGYSSSPVYRFSDPPAYGSSFTLTIQTGVKDRRGNIMKEKVCFRIKADGASSMPPVLRAMRFPLKPGAAPEDLAVYTTEDQFADFPLRGENYTFDTELSAWIELYFETAGGSSVPPDPLSLMDVFSVGATNGALNFSPRTLVFSGFTVPEPALAWGALYRVEIRGMLTNRPYTGMVTVEVKAGLKDALGNKSARPFRFLLIK